MFVQCIVGIVQEDIEAIGINKLLDDSNQIISLIPSDMERMEIRNGD